MICIRLIGDRLQRLRRSRLGKITQGKIVSYKNWQTWGDLFRQLPIPHVNLNRLGIIGTRNRVTLQVISRRVTTRALVVDSRGAITFFASSNIVVRSVEFSHGSSHARQAENHDQKNPTMRFIFLFLLYHLLLNSVICGIVTLSLHNSTVLTAVSLPGTFCKDFACLYNQQAIWNHQGNPLLFRFLSIILLCSIFEVAEEQVPHRNREHATVPSKFYRIDRSIR